ncbi:MAG: hypothetical protein JNK07_19790 [Alphaproteobacteria bacterium]|nr:hypothetical protein [Alphaproteobacteria bacterium]
MNRIAAAAVGFVAGVFATSAAMVWAPRMPWQEEAVAPEALDLREPKEPALLNADPLGELDVVPRIAMMRWLAAHPQYEFVTRDYCGCLDLPEPVCPEPGYVSTRGDYPYTESRDYNRDGHKDIAIMVGLKGKEGPQELLIFNGPFGDAVPEPVFRREGWRSNDRVNEGFVGPNESDDGYEIQAKGKTYELVYMGNPL